MTRRGDQRTQALAWTRPVLWYWLPVVLHAAAIFYVSSLSHPETVVPSLLEDAGDKVAHGVVYGVLGVLCYRALRRAAGGWAARHALGLAVAAAIGYGITDELHQAFVPERDADVWDLVADAAGAALATWTWHRVATRRDHR